MSAQIDHSLAETLVLDSSRAGLSMISFGFYSVTSDLAASYSSLKVDYYTTNTGPSFSSVFTPFTVTQKSAVVQNFDTLHSLVGTTFASTTNYSSNLINYAGANDPLGNGAVTIPLSIQASYGSIGGDVWVSTSDAHTTLRTVSHETGHALGLGDSGTMSGIKGTQFDNQEFTMMSGNSRPNANSEVTSPQVLDVLALQLLYGPGSGGSGDTTYAGIASTDYLVIWDSSGTDEISSAGAGSSAFVDLRPGRFSSIGSGSDVAVSGGAIQNTGVENVAVAFGAFIENATGSSQADGLIGNDFTNNLKGGDGDDVIFGDGSQLTGDLAGSGDYSYVSSSRILTSYQPNASSQHDLLYGGAGDDTLYGGVGADVLMGDVGKDTARGGQGDDVIYGNQQDDILYGNQGADVLYGGQGNDAIYGGQNNDIIYGNLGDDLLFGNLGDDTIYGAAVREPIAIQQMIIRRAICRKVTLRASNLRKPRSRAYGAVRATSYRAMAPTPSSILIGLSGRRTPTPSR